MSASETSSSSTGGGGGSVTSSSTTSATTTGVKSLISGRTQITATGSGQATQVRVVVPTNLMATPSMIKQIEGVAVTASGRTQISALPASSIATTRTVSNTSITVTRPITQTTYLPRANVTATPMTGVGVATTATGQRLVTPIRATPASTVTGATVTGLTAGGSFVRSATTTTVNRNTSSPATTVISPATSTTWMAANTAGQVQLIRAIPHPPRRGIITSQGLATGTGVVTNAGTSSGGAIVSGTVVAAATTIGNLSATPQSIQTSSGQSLQTVVSSAASPLTSQPQQPTYVATLATVLPPRQHQATLVYSSNAAATAAGASAANPISPNLTQQNAQTFNPTLATGQRFAVATSLTAANSTAGSTTRQIRQIPLAKPISTTKLSTASISIRAPNLPQLAPSIATVTATSGGAITPGTTGATVTATGCITTGATAAIATRSNTVTGSTATANILPGTNLSTTRIIQLQQQPGSTAQQIIGSTGRLAGNVMLQPFIVNTTGGNKIGLRPPVTMAAKGQPSLTITHMGISKLPTTVGTAANVVSVSQAQNVAAGLPSLNSGVATIATNLTTTPTIVAASTGASTLGVNVSTTVPTVSLATTTGLLTTQNNITSAAGGATVVPLAITTRGGTITSIKSANGITVGKVMTANTAAGSPTATDSGSTTPATSASVFLQQARPASSGGSGSGSPALSTTSTVSVASATSSAAYLPPGSTIYYESVPASSVQVSTGVLSITTTTLTSGTMSQQQTTSAAGSVSTSTTSSSSGLPFVANSTTFTVVPAAATSGTRTIGQLQLPISSSGISTTGGAHIQAVRFSTPLTAASETGIVQQPVLMTTSNTTTASQHMVIPLQTSIKVTNPTAPGSTTVVSNFLRKRDNAGSTDSGSPIRAAKNLGPTLLSMGTSPAASSPTSVSSTSSALSSAIVATSSATSASTTAMPSSLSPAPSTSSNFSTISSGGFANVNTSSVTGNVTQTTPTVLTVEALTKKDRAAALTCTPPRRSRGASPASSEGSTTVSANSSPGVEQQMAQEECSNLNVVMQNASSSGHHHGDSGSSTHFNPIHELYPNHHKPHAQMSVDNIQHQMDSQSMHAGTSLSSSSTSLLATAAMSQRLNGGLIGDGCPPHKRSRRATTDSQLSNQSQPSTYSLGNTVISGGVNIAGIDYSGSGNALLHNNCGIQPDDINSSNSNHSGSTNQHKLHSSNNPTQMVGNKENAKPFEYFFRRPRNCTMINTCKSNWKSANNHFQRHTDVKQREERRPTVIDVANQANIQGKLAGWKVHHLRAQMEDLAENETSSFEKLTEMLKKMEGHEKTPDIERICDLLKGNIQRNKIIVDGINEAKNQIMKIFDHQTHVSEILSRCASKRNFKKRDKV